MRTWLLVAVVAGVLLSACAPRISQLPVSEGQRPAHFPEQQYRQAAARGEAVYRVDPAASSVVIEVYRGGSLARLGHDHVVASHVTQGYVQPDAGRADLYVALDRLVVDEPALRAEAGFDTHPSPEDIAGTRRNMLVRVLDTDRYPFVVVSVAGVDGDEGARTATVSITLHGATRAMRIPLQMSVNADDMIVSGAFAVRQTDFGIAPLSILGGAVQVKDEVALRFRIHALRLR
jgi:hypothetical protein